MKTAVILAAGLISRLKKKTEHMPKGFLKVDGVSLIERSVLKLVEAGIEDIFIGTGYLKHFYDKFKETYPQIICIKNDIYETSGSMYTLFRLKDVIKNDFLLLESDLLYDRKGLETLISDPRKDLILSSDFTKFNDDEVFIETDENNHLINMSKKREGLDAVYSELVGISKVSLSTYHEMCNILEQVFNENRMFDYEYAFVKATSKRDVCVLRLDNYVWCEIDDESHLERAMNKIYPLIV